MEKVRVDAGFTITEVIVTIIVMSLFLMLFFQLLFASESQRLKVTQRAAANDIASSNLQKISSRALIPSSTATTCDSSGSSPNNTLTNPSLNPLTAGGVIATNESTAGSMKWNGDGSPTSGLTKESTANTILSGTNIIQKLVVIYPRGCEANMPAKIISIVSYGTESIIHAAYVK